MKLDDQLITFPFKDQRWVGKFVVGGLLSLCGMLIPLFLIPLSGYRLRVMRRALDNDGTLSLPDWDDWGDLIGSGLKVWLVTIVYGLPLWVMVLCGFGMMAAGSVLFPIGLSEESLLAMVGIVLALMGVVAFGVGTILAFPVGFLIPVALARMASYDSLNSAFQFGEVWRELKTGFKHYVLAFLFYFALAMGASIAASLLLYSVCLTCLYPFALGFAAVYTVVMYSTLFGLAYRETRALAGGSTDQVEAAG